MPTLGVGTPSRGRSKMGCWDNIPSYTDNMQDEEIFSHDPKPGHGRGRQEQTRIRGPNLWTMLRMSLSDLDRIARTSPGTRGMIPIRWEKKGLLSTE